MKPPLVWVLAGIAGVLVMSVLSFWMAVRPPRIIVPGVPRDYRLPSEDLVIRGVDGVKLAAWYIPAGTKRSPAETPVVVLLHGYPASKADLLSIAGALHPQIATLLVDHRYFGAR